jgi:hypothetical protein
MFQRRGFRDEAWEGVVSGKKRSSPDGQNMYHRIVITLSDGATKEIRVRHAMWHDLNVGDRLVKQPGDKYPARAS